MLFRHQDRDSFGCDRNPEAESHIYQMEFATTLEKTDHPLPSRDEFS